MSGNLIGILGIVVIIAIAVAFSTNRRAINLRIVGAAFGLQVVVAIFVLYSSWGRSTIDTISGWVMNVIGYSKAGIDMVFGPLADANIIGFSFAVNVLPIIIFFSALMSVLYHLRIMQFVVKLVGGIRAGMGYVGAGSLQELRDKARFIKISFSSLKESHAHDIEVTKEPPNYYLPEHDF